uniref:Tubulin glycylase 3A-like n=1 Tax=Dendroctonus ponderosae TaxID=77166 RepID=A0AAR5PL66_DENPD
MSIKQDPKSFTKPEKELRTAISNCKTELQRNSASQQKPRQIMENEPKDDITLEKVVRDMAHVFYNLKNGISLVKSSIGMQRIDKESTNNMENELEKIYKRQENLNREKEEEAAKKAKEQERKKSAPPNPAQNKKASLNRKASKNQASEPSKNLMVMNIQFPPERLKNHAVTAGINAPRSRSSDSPTLRKPSADNQKKSLSVPPPREVYNPLGIIKDEVEKAMRQQMTFTIKGQFPAVRRALLKRGWIEKYHTSHRDRLNADVKRYQQLDVTELVDLMRNKSIAETVKKIIKSKLLRDHQVDLYWDHTFDAFKECPDTKKMTLINRFRRESLSYTSKQGLCQAARDAHWLQIPGLSKINHPRCYVLMKGGDTKSFLKDFGLTAAISLLKWVVKTNITGECRIVSETGKIPMKIFDFAIAECYKFIKKEKHQDIDEEIREALEIEWHEFLDQYYKTVHVGNHFKLMDKTIHPCTEAKDMVRKANYLLNQLREHIPTLEMDGYMNIWILKPTNSSRGQGIHICRTLQYILDVVKKNPNRRYIIQKYIERPMLIHDTKFDIRQWFLVSSSDPLVIWIYRVCYLRFSSQTYNLRKLDESIHLTNNSVQAKYLQHGTKDPLLPSYAMWDSKEFKMYLSDIGYPQIFETAIYPSMKQSIIGAMLAHRDKIDNRKNCFELYGADFMLAESFEPWLLEINSNPALHASTPVTAKLCPQVLEDVIKVVVDYARNPKSSTGNFELIYQEKGDVRAVKPNQKFQLTGFPLSENYFCDLEEPPLEHNAMVPKRFETPDPGKYLLQTGQTMKEALKNLLEIVKREKSKRGSRREKCIEAKLAAYDSCNQTHSEVISLFQNLTLSQKLDELESDDNLTENESRRVTEVLSEIKNMHNKKRLLTSLVQVVDTLKKAKKGP